MGKEMTLVRSDRSYAYNQGVFAAMDGRPVNYNPYLRRYRNFDAGSARAWGRGWFAYMGMKRNVTKFQMWFKELFQGDL